ncbi:hypothetical protein Ahia01_001215900 [Argonauta hians]
MYTSIPPNEAILSVKRRLALEHRPAATFPSEGIAAMLEFCTGNKEQTRKSYAELLHSRGYNRKFTNRMISNTNRKDGNTKRGSQTKRKSKTPQTNNYTGFSYLKL